MSWMKKVSLISVLVVAGCGGGSGGDNNTEQPPVVEPPVTAPEEVRLYQIGDVVEFSGTLSTAQSASPPVVSEIVSRVEFLDNVYSEEGKNVLAMRTTITVVTGGAETSATTHIWQETNGAIYDLTDLYGNYYLNSATNENGLLSVPVPIIDLSEEELQFYTMLGAPPASSPVTMGSRSIRVGNEESTTVPAGTFAAHPVVNLDDYSYLVTYDIYKKDQAITRDETNWVSKEKGIIKVTDIQKVYSSTGGLLSTTTLEMQATKFNF